MPRKKLRRDLNETAFDIVQQATGGARKRTGEKNPEAVKRGQKGGKKGGRVRADSLTPDQRAEAARLAARARWKRSKKSD